MKKEKNPYYDENGILKVRPLSYKLNADDAEGSKEDDDKIILNTVDSIIKRKLKETADKTGQTAKEERIREAGGNYVRTSDGSLAEFPNDLHTTIERRK